MSLALEAAVPLFQQQQKFVLTTHVNPDGDGLGSEIALAEWLSSQGKEVTILNHSDTPSNYRFLDPHKRIFRFDPSKDSEAIAEADVIVIFDTNQPERLKSMQHQVLQSKATRVCIDHHPEPSPFAHHYLIDETATSTGEITYSLLLRLNGEHLPPLIAQALYCAIMTDTGSFRYSNVDPDIHRIVAHLLECGADPQVAYRSVYEQWSPGRIQLLGRALETLSTEYDGALAHITVTQEMLRHTGTSEVDTDNFTTYPMSVGGVVVGILFLELKDGIKISFRSRGDIPINELAKEFQGNGHKNAAGARLYNVSLDMIKPRVLLAAGKYLQAERKQ